MTARRLGRLADWVAAKFRSQIPAQADEFYFEFDVEERELLNSGKHAGSNGVSTLVTDFICIDGIFELRGVRRTGLDWFLEASGPLSLEDRDFYEALSLSGLRAYRVVSVTEGVGIELLDLFEPAMQSGFVHEALGSTQMSVNDVIGARLVASDGVMHIAAMVLFHPEDGDLLTENYVEDLAMARAQAGFSEDAADDFDDDIVDAHGDTAAIETTAQNTEAQISSARPIQRPGRTEDDIDESEKTDSANGAAEPEAFDENAIHSIVDEMTLQDSVAARVVSTYWLESVLNSLRPEPLESAADE